MCDIDHPCCGRLTCGSGGLCDDSSDMSSSSTNSSSSYSSTSSSTPDNGDDSSSGGNSVNAAGSDTAVSGSAAAPATEREPSLSGKHWGFKLDQWAALGLTGSIFGYLG